MTVKEIFDLRKQGHIEEAYEAIRPMYAAYKGRYTSLCMFWTASDVFKLRLEQGRVEEATKILEALKRMLPRIEEITKELDNPKPDMRPDEAKLPWENNDRQSNGNAAARFIEYAERRLASLPPPATVPAGSPAAPPAPIDSVDEPLNPGQQTLLTAIRTNPGLRIPALS